MNTMKHIYSYFVDKLNENKLNPALVTAILTYLIITPIDAILYLQWINSMTNYRWICGGIIYPFFGFLFFAVPTLYKMYKKDINLNCSINELAKIGLMDSLGSVLTALVIPFISIMLNVIVSKLVLPMTMVASYIFLNKRYLWTHYLGICITIFGIIVASVPKLLMDDDNTNALAMIIFVISLIPSVASFVIKENYLKENFDANSLYMNTIISGFQIMVGVFTLPLVMLPLPGLNVKPNEFGQYISNALSCQFGGINSTEGDNCQYSFLYLIAFQLFGTIANLLMFTIIREGSSVTFIMVNTLKTPITALMGFFLIYYNVVKFTEGESFIITWLDVVSLIFVLIGSIFYGFNKEIELDQYAYSHLNMQDDKISREKILKPLLILDEDETKSSNSIV